VTDGPMPTTSWPSAGRTASASTTGRPMPSGVPSAAGRDLDASREW
jgi:hypothetical protein